MREDSRMGRIHIKGGSIISMDPSIKDMPFGDVLVEDGNIAAVAPSLSAGGAETIDAAGMSSCPA
jgi:dihydroorotase-like cyclic amidohydrolase